MKKLPLNNIALLKSKIGLTNVFSENTITTYLNPYSYLYYRKNTSLFSQFDCIAIDGYLLVWLMNIFVLDKSSKLRRFSFDMTSIAPVVFKECEENGDTIIFVGSKEDDIKKFVKKISFEYEGLRIIYFRNGYFQNEKEKALCINEIVARNPNYVIVGMGSPHQENFLVDLKLAGYRGIGHTCGGFIHQTAKSLEYYPRWVNKLNLRWAFRIWDEPYLFKRYFLKYPISIVLFLKDAINYKISFKET